MTRLTVDDFPTQATHDEDGALRQLLAEQLARQVYRVPGQPARAGYLVDGSRTPPEGRVYIYPEWADSDQPIAFPSIVLLDGEGSDDTTGILAPYIDEASTFPPYATHPGELDRLQLRVEGRYTVDLRAFVHATDKPWRRACLRGIRAAVSGAMDYAENYKANKPDRLGIVLNAGNLYYGQDATFVPTRLMRADSEDNAGNRHRMAQRTIRASIPLCEVVLLPALDVRPTDLTDQELSELSELGMSGLGMH